MSGGGTIVGVDVGGTFTDLFLLDASAGRFRTAKVPSHRGDEIGVGLQQLPHVIDIARFDRGLEQLGRRSGQRLDLSLHVRPAGKAVSARNHQLGIAQDKIFRRRGCRVQRAHARDRFRFAAPIVACEGLGELSLFIQVRIGGKRANEALGVATRGFLG